MARTPKRVADEAAWELLRDEWELLLAIGSGPTRLQTAAARLDLVVDRGLERRVALLVEHGLVEEREGGLGLVPAYHQRQEGMASYLRDLVLSRVDVGGAPPLGGAVRFGLGREADVERLLRRADADLFPGVVEAASRPETDRSTRFLAVFVAAGDCPGPAAAPAGSRGFRREDLLRVLRTAAAERARGVATTSSKVWVAEMRVDPEVAHAVAERMEAFLAAAPEAPGPGAAAFAVWPVSPAPGAGARS